MCFSRTSSISVCALALPLDTLRRACLQLLYSSHQVFIHTDQFPLSPSALSAPPYMTAASNYFIIILVLHACLCPFSTGEPSTGASIPCSLCHVDAFPSAAQDALDTLFFIQPHPPHFTDGRQNSENLKECKIHLQCLILHQKDSGLRCRPQMSYCRSLYGHLIHQQMLVRLRSCRAVQLKRRKATANSSDRKHTADLMRYLKFRVIY